MVIDILTFEFPYQNIALASGLLLLVVALLFYFIDRRKTAVSRKINAIIKPLKQDELREFVIPDGIGGLMQIKHLVLMKDGLLVIETYPISGNLFGADNIDLWTQIIEGRSFKFTNPLGHIHDAMVALQLLAPKVPIYCRVIFTADSHFPKGKPEQVSILESLEMDIQPLLKQQENAEASDYVVKSWERIMRIARKNGQSLYQEAMSK